MTCRGHCSVPGGARNLAAQKADPDYAYDTPVPSAGMPAGGRDAMAASIGKLGPADLRS